MAILEGVNLFKVLVKINHIFKRNRFFLVVLDQQPFQGLGNICRSHILFHPHRIGRSFIIAHPKPRLARIRSMLFEQFVKPLDVLFG